MPASYPSGQLLITITNTAIASTLSLPRRRDRSLVIDHYTCNTVTLFTFHTDTYSCPEALHKQYTTPCLSFSYPRPGQLRCCDCAHLRSTLLLSITIHQS